MVGTLVPRPTQYNCYSLTEYAKAVPDNVHPCAEIQFPPRDKGANPIVLKVLLTERC